MPATDTCTIAGSDVLTNSSEQAVDTAMAAMQDDLAILDAEANLASGGDVDNGWLIDWYMQQQVMLDAAAAAIDQQAAILHRQCEARRKALEWKYRQPFEAEATKRLQALKKGKTVETFFGKFGLRQTGGKPHVEFTDKDEAIACAEIIAPEAVTIKKDITKTAVLNLAAKGITLNGVEIVTEEKHDRFFVSPVNKGLPKVAEQIEGESNNG